MAITFYRMTPSELVVLCFYDYDPQTNILTPEKSLANLFEPSFPGYRYRVFLPQNDKVLIVNEYFGSITIQHTYGWDYFGVNDNPFTQYAMLDIDHDGKPELLLQSDDESIRAVYAISLTINLIAGQNGSRFLSFYKDAVCHSGSCGALCMSSVYVVLNESYPKTYLSELWEWNEEAEDYVISTYTLDGKEISKKKGENIVRTLGEPYEPDLKWTELDM